MVAKAYRGGTAACNGLRAPLSYTLIADAHRARESAERFVLADRTRDRSNPARIAS
jgi:hypothetical protein